MSALNQKTIINEINISGIGLHSGEDVKLKIKPALPNSGIIFKRVDLNSNNIVLPSVYNVSSANYCTTISNDFGVCVSTIEHLMGALYCLGVDNALIEIDNIEVPILDGSAKIFVNEIKKVGLKISESPIKVIKIEKKVKYEFNEKKISIEPSNLNLFIDFEIKYSNSIISTQRNKINVYESNLEDICNSRTFCLYDDISKLRDMNLARGGSLDNAIVIKDDEILNEEKLRNPKEFVNHKILDCIGDLYLSGYRIIGNLKCSQGGHKITNELLRKVFDDKDNYSIIEVNEKKVSKALIEKSILKSIA